jgi:hypothetical protein
MGPIGYAMIAVVVVGVIGGLIAMAQHQKKEEAARDRYRKPKATPTPKREEPITERLGAPIFEDMMATRKRRPIGSVDVGDAVWCVTPYGVMRGEIQEDVGDQIAIDCGDYTVHGKFVPEFFSQGMATKLGIDRSAWIVADIQKNSWDRISGKVQTYSGGGGRRYPATIRQHEGALWLRNNSIFGEFAEIMIEELWFELMFGGFAEDVAYYEELEPIREDGELTGDVTNWVTAEEQGDYESTLSMVDEAAERAAETGEPQITAEQDSSDFFASQSMIGSSSGPSDPPPAPSYDPVEETKPTYSPPAAPSYEPPPSSYDGGGGGGEYDGGGGDCGGGGDD